MSMRPRNAKEVSISQERIYDLIRSPLVTEKTTLLGEYGKVAFQVPLDATKPEIKVAIEKLFDVKVTAVNTLVQKGKLKRLRGKLGKRADMKKAIVTLAEGHNIDIATGV